MQITGDERKKRDEIVKKLDFLGYLCKMVNLIDVTNLNIEVTADPETRRFDYEVKESEHTLVKEKLNDMLDKGSDGKAIIDELMRLKEKGVPFSYLEANRILELPEIKEFKKKNKAIETSVIKTKVIRAVCQKDLDEATKVIVDLIYKSDQSAQHIIAATINEFKPDPKLKRKIMKELNNDERVEGYLLRYWSNEVFKDGNITDGRSVVLGKVKPFEELNMEPIKTHSKNTDAYDDLDLQEDSNILKDGGVNALITYLQENDIDERSFDIGDFDEILKSFKDVKLIHCLDFVNKLERIAMGEIEDQKGNKKEFKSKHIDKKASRNDIYVIRIYEQINDKYYVPRDMAREILNLPSIQIFKDYYKLLSQNVDKIKLRSVLLELNAAEEKKILVKFINGDCDMKLESILKELVTYTEEINSLGETDEIIYNEAKKRCGELFLHKMEDLKDLVQRMNKNVLKNDQEKLIDTKDIEDMFTADDSEIENKIIQNLKFYSEKNDSKEAKYALSEIDYMERLGNLLEQFEINITVPKVRETIKELVYEDNKDKQAMEIVKLIVEKGKEEKIQEAILLELEDSQIIDSKLQSKIDILLEKARDDKKITPKEHIEWVRDIMRIHRHQREKGMEI